MTKHCYRCKKDLPLENFGTNNTKWDKKASSCKTCRQIYQKDWYSKNTEEHKKRVYKTKGIYIKKTFDIVMSFLLDGCKDCGNKNLMVLEFDHLYGKDFSISSALSGGRNLDILLSEIKKCEVVCSNCHKIRTHTRMKSKKYREEQKRVK